jgi:RNA polymerase sigma factor (sigma-70 family)
MIQNTNFYRYMEETRQYPVLKEDEVRKTLSLPDKEDKINEIILRNMQFVCRLVLSWRYNANKLGIDLMDLVGAGNIGLIQGTMKYSSEKGSYYKYVSRYIRSFIESEFYKYCNCSRKEGKKKIRLHQNINPTDSLSKIVSDNGEDEPVLLQDTIASPEDETNTRLEVKGVLNGLRQNGKKVHKLASDIIDYRYGVGCRKNHEPMSLSQAAKAVNMSKEGVRKIENRVLRYMQAQLSSQ